MARRRIASVLGGRVLVWGHYDETRPVGEDTIGTGRNRITTPVYEYDAFGFEHVDDFPLRMSVLERAWEESRATATRELQDPKPTTLSARIDLAFGQVFPKGSLGAPTLRTNTLSQSSTTSLNTAAFDVDAGDLIVVCGTIINTADPGAVTVTDDSGHTWTPQQQAVQADSAISTRVFCSTAYAADADNIIVTVDPTGTGIRWNIHVYTIPGADPTTPVVQSKLSQGNETSPSVTLDSTTDVKMVFGFIGVRNDADGVTFGSDFTELTDSVSGGTSPAASQAQYDIDPVDGTSDWSDVAATSSVRIALGIMEADEGGGENKDVTAAVVGVAAVASPMNTVRSVQASAAGVAAVASPLNVVRSVQATAGGQASVSATLNVVRSVQASVTGQAAVTSAANAVRSLQATVSGVATVAVNVSTITPSLTATVTGQATVSVSVAALRSVTAAASGSATVSVTMQTVRSGAAQVSGQTSLAVQLNTIRALQASVSGQATVSAEPTVPEEEEAEVTGKYRPEHAAALQAVRAAQGFGPEHAAALRAVRDAGV